MKFTDVEPFASRLADSNRVEDAWRLRGLADRSGNEPRAVGPDESYSDEYNEGYGTVLRPFTALASEDDEDNSCCYCGAAARVTNVGPSGAVWATCADLDCLAQGEPA